MTPSQGRPPMIARLASVTDGATLRESFWVMR